MFVFGFAKLSRVFEDKAEKLFPLKCPGKSLLKEELGGCCHRGLVQGAGQEVSVC